MNPTVRDAGDCKKEREAEEAFLGGVADEHSVPQPQGLFSVLQQPGEPLLPSREEAVGYWLARQMQYLRTARPEKG